MRITYPTNLSLSDQVVHPLVLTGDRGERIQISVLEEDLIRVQHWPDGRPRLNRTWMIVDAGGEMPREGRRRDDLSPFTLPSCRLETAPGVLALRTRQLGLEVALGNPGAGDASPAAAASQHGAASTPLLAGRSPGRDCAQDPGSQVSVSALLSSELGAGPRLRWTDDRGCVFAADLAGRAYAYDRAGQAVFHYLERLPGEHYYGFGEKAGPLNKAGMRMRMVSLDALGYNAQSGDPLYKHFPFYITFLPDRGIAYGLLYDNLSSSVFDLGRELDNYYPPYRYYQAGAGDLDYYLIYGPSIEQVVEKLAVLTGRMALPPRWSLGYLGSTMTYTDAPDAQEQLKQFVRLCRQHRIPCDGFHLSSGYTTGDDDKRYVFNWNFRKIPDPQDLTDTFHEAGIRLAANIKPALLTSHPRFREVAELGGFIQDAETGQPALSAFWGGLGAHIDFTNPAAYDWWRQRVRDRLLAFGIDATWNDNNEYPIWDDEARCAGFGEPLAISHIRPLHALLMSRASWEAQKAYRPDERPYLISRSACPGIQRYAQTWSGDNSTSWNTLRYNIPMGLGLGLSGAPNTGHDVGGFDGPRPDRELFIRWVQNGIFHPRFTIHSWNTDGSVNEPWMYEDAIPIIREAIEFRYRLLPYLYSLVFEAAQTGHPIIRPLVYHFPGDARCRDESFDFLLGPNLLVASVLEPNARRRAVYLPVSAASGNEGKSSGWYDFHTGQWHAAGQVVEVDAPLERIPLFVPDGGIIPLGKAMRHVREQPDDVRQAYVFPHPMEGCGSFTLVEDDGISLGCLRGEYTEVELTVIAEQQRIVLRLEMPTAGFSLPYASIEFILPPGEGRPVVTTQQNRQWLDAVGRRHVVVPLGAAVN